MEIKKELIVGIFLFAFLVSIALFTSFSSITLVSAGSPNVTSPSSGANITSTFLNCSYANATTSVTQPTDAQSLFYQNSTGSDVIILCDTKVITNNSVSCTATAAQLTDALTQKISCQVGNATAKINSTDNATGVNIYTDASSCLFTTDSESTTFLSPIGIVTTDLSTKDAIATLTYAWEVFRSDESNSSASTIASPTFSGTDFDEKGTFKIGLTVSDNVGTASSCTNKTILVKSSDGDTIAIVTQQVTEGGRRTVIWWIAGIVILAVVIVVAYFVITQSKKKR